MRYEKRWKRKKYDNAWQEYCDLEPNGGGITLFAGHTVNQNGNHLEFIKAKIESILKTGFQTTRIIRSLEKQLHRLCA
jgi:hypothetical protein